MTCASSWCSRSLAGLALAAAACGGGDLGNPDPVLEAVEVSAVQPTTILAGTRLVVTGRGFVAEPWATARLRLRGTLTGPDGTLEVDLEAAAAFVDFEHLEVAAGAELLAELPAGGGTLSGEAIIELAAAGGETRASDPLAVVLAFARELEPALDGLAGTGVIFVNEPIAVQGDGLLLGGGEGTTFAVVEGCFTPQGGGVCAPVGPAEVPVVPDGPFDRTRGSFAFAPAIAGVQPGSFQGTVALRNEHAAGPVRQSPSQPADYELLRPAVFQVSPAAASLGQFVDFEGGGFTGGDDDSQTLIRLVGTYTPAGAGAGAPVDVLLVPEFVAGPLVRYVVNEDDAIGQTLDLRRDTGTFVGTVTPIVSYRDDEVTGDAANVSLRIAPVKQVVYVKFLPSYVESLRHFGLRAVDAQIRARVLEVARRDYATVNVEFRLEPPADFAYYAQVDISGPDPNGQGLLGYDNSPGKDNDNHRLFDRIGGVNATTQEDGFAGYGGVFIESLFAFSKHPEGHAREIDASSADFDLVFDPFRPDRDGKAVSADDFAGGIVELASGASCPAAAGDRAMQVACSIWVLGSLIGTTMTHEVGHSLGLANPGSEGFHNFGDEPNRLMDAGGARSFNERAELHGEGPARFCDDEYTYLRRILPSDEPEDPTPRPGCF